MTTSSAPRSRATRRAKLTYPGFGTFSKRRRGERTVRNPQTGDPIAIPAQSTITFSPGQELRSLLNRNGQERRQSRRAPAKRRRGVRSPRIASSVVTRATRAVAAPLRYNEEGCWIRASSSPTCTFTSGRAVAPHILWSIAHEQGFKLPVQTYWEFRDLVTARARQGELARRLPGDPAPVDREDSVVARGHRALGATRSSARSFGRATCR